MSKVTMTDNDLHQAACDLMDLVEDSSLNIDRIKDSLCLSFFGCDYQKARQEHLEVVVKTETEKPVYVLATFGSNTILARNGVYVSATNPGTDMEIPYRVLADQAISMAMAENEESLIREIELPDVLARIDFESDDKLVEMLDKMQLFSLDPCIFKALEKAMSDKGEDASKIFIDRHRAEEIEYFSAELEIMPNQISDEVVLTATTRPKAGLIVDDAFTFDELCRARYRKNNTWDVPVTVKDETVRVYIGQ